MRRLSPWLVAALASGYLFLYGPILSLVIYSFNDSPIPNVWRGFTLKWYAALAQDHELQAGLWLSLKIANKQSSVSSLGDQIDDWDVRIALRRTALEKTYAALEVSLSNLNAQSSWLTSAIESLSTSTS